MVVDVSDRVSRGLTAVMVYAPRELRSFRRTTAVLDELGLTIVDARIVPMRGTRTSPHLLRTGERRQPDPGAPAAAGDTFPSAEGADRRRRAPAGGLPARAAASPHVLYGGSGASVSQDPVNNRTVLELVAADRPGLLLQLGTLFEEHDVVLHNAKNRDPWRARGGCVLHHHPSQQAPGRGALRTARPRDSRPACRHRGSSGPWLDRPISPTFVARASRRRCGRPHGRKDAEGIADTMSEAA